MRVPRGAALVRRHVEDVIDELPVECLMVSTIDEDASGSSSPKGDMYSELTVPAECTFDEVRALLIRAARRMTA